MDWKWKGASANDGCGLRKQPMGFVLSAALVQGGQLMSVLICSVGRHQLTVFCKQIKSGETKDHYGMLHIS